MTKFVVYDVFTDHAFGGNQLAVIPDAANLPEDQLQKIAREFNFSESTFLFPPENPAHTARVRIFTPNQEIQFAGHPTIGTAIALADLGHKGDMVLELGVGPIRCSVDGNAAAFTTDAALEILGHPTPELVARALGLPETAVVTTTHMPTQATLGLPFVFCELDSRDTLRGAQPVMDAMREGATLHPAGMDFAVFCYVRNDMHIDARMFAPLDSIPEDPATGSASATLAALLSRHLAQDVDLTIHQGDDMGRPSRIFAKSAGAAITITGRAVQTMIGELILPNAP